MSLSLLFGVIGSAGFLGFVIDAIRLYANRSKSKAETNALDVSFWKEGTEQVVSALQDMVATQQTRILFLERQLGDAELKLEERDRKVELLSARLSTMMEQMAEMQDELRELKRR